MQATSILTDEIMGQANAYREAKHQFDYQFLRYIETVPPLAPEHFWPVVDEFRKVLLQTMCVWRESAVEKAADEFLRLAVVSGGDFAAAVHFCVSWRHYTAKACAAGDAAPFSWDRGDDGYGDLMDALPILGQIVNRRLVLGKFATLREFNEQVDATCDSLGRVLKDMVLRGENYFAMSLEEAAKKWIVIQSRHRCG